MGKKVLIVEDEFIVANDLRIILKRSGYDVTGIASSTTEAGEFMGRQRPDLAILDIRLEGKLSGIDLASKLKDENIAFIYLSANSNQQILEQAKATEPYGFLVKPFREKDLLVTLDVAWYLHEHSLASRLRQEQNLQNQLADLVNDTSDAGGKFLKLAKAIQYYIPFDYIASGLRPLDPEHFTDPAYLRIGFDEYQFIGEKELLTISGLQRSRFTDIVSQTKTNSKPGIYSIPERAGGKDNSGLHDLLMDQFRLKSFLVFPVSVGYGVQFNYFFYSRKHDAYTKDHLAVLNRMKPSLEELAEIIVYDQTSTLKQQQLHPPKTNRQYAGFNGIIGTNHLLLSALDLAAQVAPYNTSVLLLGESGTGKEKVAQSIHHLSPVKDGPFIKVNCAAIPDTLIESELFGHEKGSFTGATEKRKGKFEQADGGTIFLDEIGELPLGMQVKLLRVLQEKEIEHVGGSAPVKINVRIVAATSRNLEKEVSDGNFRLDLYYRLNVFPITLPPLRERRSDIEALALHFADKFCSAFKKLFTGIDRSMLDHMYNYDWPGNIRELENVVEQSVVLNDGRGPLQLRRTLKPTASGMGPEVNTMEDVKHMQQETERYHITSVLRKTRGRVRGINGAAAILNIKPTTLEARMARLSISRHDFSNTPER